MIGIFSLLILGFIFGIRHAFDADHIAAVAILARNSGTKKQALLRGAAWGLGHTFVLLVAGFLVLVFGLHVPPAVSVFFELAVGVLLIAFGTYTFTGQGIIVHSHPPLDLHTHRPSFFVGMMHGLAGSAAVLVAIISVVRSPFVGLLYIVVFGIGSIIGMSLLGLALGSTAHMAKKYFSLAAGMFSLGSGILILFNFGFAL